jgi:putative Mn2+ efflux pump MntP
LTDALKLAALVLPLGLDTLGVAVAMGLAGVPRERRTRLAVLFAAFETAMPLLGAALGVPLGRTFGEAADVIAAALLVALGVHMLRSREDEQDASAVPLGGGGVFAAVALGLSVSMDELAIGFSVGLLGLPLLPFALAVGAQAFVVTEIGLRLGQRAGARWAGAGERVAGVALLALGAILIAERLAG